VHRFYMINVSCISVIFVYSHAEESCCETLCLRRKFTLQLFLEFCVKYLHFYSRAHECVKQKCVKKMEKFTRMPEACKCLSRAVLINLCVFARENTYFCIIKVHFYLI
jgi:hypothetical protein